jgi:hypothetical protein
LVFESTNFQINKLTFLPQMVVESFEVLNFIFLVAAERPKEAPGGA